MPCIFTFKSEGSDSLSYSTPTGQSYTAKLDGKDVPYVGDPGTTTVRSSVRGNSIVETDKRDGKVDLGQQVDSSTGRQDHDHRCGRQAERDEVILRRGQTVGGGVEQILRRGGSSGQKKTNRPAGPCSVGRQ